jgi:hypothetical protein
MGVSQPCPSFGSGQDHIKPVTVAVANFTAPVVVSLFVIGLPH